jgi:hypothetical protein
MNQPVAQAVALATHVNGALAGLPLAPFFPGHSTCAGCESVRFLDAPPARLRKPVSTLCAATPDAWFGWLADAGARRAVLEWIPPQAEPAADAPAPAVFRAANGHWALETRHGRAAARRWSASWAPHRVGRDKLWRVEYTASSRGRAEPPPIGDLGVERTRLAVAIEDAQAFSTAHQLAPVAERLAQARDTLATGTLHGSADLAPEGLLGAPARSLLDACQSAWVFGGLGTWSELLLEGPQHRDFLITADALLRALVAAVPAAVDDNALRGAG